MDQNQKSEYQCEEHVFHKYQIEINIINNKKKCIRELCTIPRCGEDIAAFLAYPCDSTYIAYYHTLRDFMNDY